MHAEDRVYRAGRLTLASTIALPELQPVARATPDWRVELRRRAFTWTTVPRVFHRWTQPNGSPWLTLSRAGDDYHLQFARTASFALRMGERRILCRPSPDVPRMTLRHLLLDQVLPLVVSAGEALVLHASAVHSPRGAVLFVGASGRGKSTIAASLALSGWPLVTDDTVAIAGGPHGPHVWAAASSARLWPDSLRALRLHIGRRATRVAHYSRKRRIAFDATDDRAPIPVHRVYVLGSRAQMRRAAAVSVLPLTARDATVAIIRHAFQLDIDDRAALAKTFELSAWIATTVDVRSLAFPWTLNRLETITSAVVEDIVNG
jgi:hypothetical protein